MVFLHSGARDFDLGGGFQHSGNYPMVFLHSGTHTHAKGTQGTMRRDRRPAGRWRAAAARARARAQSGARSATRTAIKLQTPRGYGTRGTTTCDARRRCRTALTSGRWRISVSPFSRWLPPSPSSGACPSCRRRGCARTVQVRQSRAAGTRRLQGPTALGPSPSA